MSFKQAKDAMKANSAPSPASNVEAMRQGFFDQCTQFGINAGAGDTSKVGWFQAMAEAAWQGIIAPAQRRKKGDITSPPNDAELAYDAFAEARKAKAGEMGKRIKGKDGKDRPTRVSEANKMIELGSLPLIHDKDMGGLGVFQRTLKIIRENDEISGQVDDMLLKVAREQCKKPEHLLTNKQIEGILEPDGDDGPAEPKKEVELWAIVLKQIESIMNTKFPTTAGTNPSAKTARAAVVKIIDEHGGTKAMVKAREKAAEQEAKKAKTKATNTAKRREVQRQGAASRKKKR